MQRTAAILGSWDTKSAEMRYMRRRLEESGVHVIFIDVSTGVSSVLDVGSGYAAADIRQGREDEWCEARKNGRASAIAFMADRVKDFVTDLYEKEQIQGLVSAGGLQNTTLALAAMNALPLGFPKVLATTVASGHRPFASVTGSTDIVVVPAIADMSGINFATRSTLDIACSCLAGMLMNASTMVRPAGRTAAISMMGVTNNAAVGAIRELENEGYEVVGFHATGAGGAVLESFVSRGLFDAVLDLTPHEIVNEYFRGGYSFGAEDRLNAAIRKRVPLVVAPGGLDFVDYFVDQFEPGIEGRPHVFHNGRLAHIKLSPEEAEGVGKVIGERFASSETKIPLIIPLRGMRSDTDRGQALYEPTVDSALISAIIAYSDGKAAITEIDVNLDTEEFGVFIAQQLVAECASSTEASF